MSFRNNTKERTANFVKGECKECKTVIAYVDIEWVDGYPDMYCIECFKKKGYPINTEVWVSNERQTNRSENQ